MACHTISGHNNEETPPSVRVSVFHLGSCAVITARVGVGRSPAQPMLARKAAAGRHLLLRSCAATVSELGVTGFGRQAPAPATAAAATSAFDASLGSRSFAVSSEDQSYHQYVDNHRPHEAPLHHNHHAGRQHLQHPHVHEKHHRPPGPPPDVLTALSEQYAVVDSRAFKHAVHRLPVHRQFALLEHTAGVAQHLQVLGLDAAAVGCLLQHCPALFAFPAAERAEVLFSELMGVRVARSAVQAAELFKRCPALANTKHVLPELVKLVAEHHSGADL